MSIEKYLTQVNS